MICAVSFLRNCSSYSAVSDTSLIILSMTVSADKYLRDYIQLSLISKVFTVI